MRYLAFTLLIATVGYSRFKSDAPTEAGAGNYARLGPLGLSVESVWQGKIRMRGMMGQDGESTENVFTVRTRFKPQLETYLGVDRWWLQLFECRLEFLRAQPSRRPPHNPASDIFTFQE